MNPQEEYVKTMGLIMSQHPEDFMIDPKTGVLFCKCQNCTEWHKAIELNIKVENPNAS